jgi:hypothetical protein
MMKKVWMLLIVLFAVAVFSGVTHAKLTVIGTANYGGSDYKLIYEDDQGLIWLDYSLPNNRWPQQMGVVSKMNEAGVLTCKINPGININWRGPWRLPLAIDGARKNGYDGTTTAGFNITTSEYGHLYYQSLGNLGYYDTKGNPRPGWGKTRDQEGWGLKNTAPFDNLRLDSYWTGTEYSGYTQHAWDFNTYFGCLDAQCFKGSFALSGLAVRPAIVTFLMR